jgi:hypothetical protein
VELVLVLPVVAIFALVVVQVALVARMQLLVTHAAREGARAAALDPTVTAARDAVVAGAPLDPAHLDVTIAGGRAPGDRVTVQVRYRAPTDVPVVGPLVPDVVVTATATMRVE